MDLWFIYHDITLFDFPLFHTFLPALSFPYSDIALLFFLDFPFQDPFILEDEGALKEATELIENNMLWVHEVQSNGHRDIASVVATTRQSARVTAITKVYTNPKYRSKGCAERLVRRVCQQ